jgi:hypothetical protein
MWGIEVAQKRPLWLRLEATGAGGHGSVPKTDSPSHRLIRGLARLLDTIERIRRGLNPRLEVEGILLTMMDRRVNLCRQVEDEVRKHFGDRVFATVIPRNVRLSEAPSHGKPILLYDIQSKGAKSYLRLAEELLGRGEDGQPPRKPPPLPISRAREEEEGGRSNGHTP